MNDSFGPSEHHGSIVRYIFVFRNKYTGRRINMHSKPTLIHGPVQIKIYKLFIL